MIGTGEFAAMSLLPDIAGTTGVSIVEAGYIISAYAIGVMVGAPIIAVAFARLDRRAVMIVLASIVLVGNLLSALVTDFTGLLAVRFLTGLPHGAYYGLGSIVAASVVPHSQRVQAMGRLMLGLRRRSWWVCRQQRHLGRQSGGKGSSQ